MFCYALHLLDLEGGVETRAFKARVLSTPRGLADVSVPENNVWSLLLHKVILSLKNFRNKKCHKHVTNAPKGFGLA